MVRASRLFWRGLGGVGILLPLLLVWIPPADAEPVGRITSASGSADVLRTGAERALPAAQGDPVNIGDIVRTKTGSRLQVTFVDGSTINVGERSRVQITEYLFDPAKQQRRSVLSVLRGKIHALIPRIFKGEEGRYEIRTTTAVAAMRGSEGIFIVRPYRTDVLIVDGLWSVRNVAERVSGRIAVGSNEMTTVLARKPPSPKVVIAADVIKPHIQDTAPRRDEKRPEGPLPGADKGRERAGEGEKAKSGSGKTPPTPAVLLPPPPTALAGGTGPSGPPIVDRVSAAPPPPPPPPPTPPVTEKKGTININVDVR